MPNLDAPASKRYRGWYHDLKNGVLEAYYNGTRVLASTASATTVPLATTFSSTATATGAITSNLTGNAFVAATGNVAIGNPGAFATTQPQGAVIMGGTSLSGIAPAGAITTAGAIFASDTVVRKIIAASTVSNVET